MFVTFVGRVVADAELRSEGKVLSFRAAENVRVGKEDATVWSNVAYWGPGREKLVEYLTKGREVLVDGVLSVREYESKGEKRQSLEVRADNIRLVGGSKQRSDSESRDTSTTTTTDAGGDDEIPF